jgi:hypothetical protein
VAAYVLGALALAVVAGASAVFLTGRHHTRPPATAAPGATATPSPDGREVWVFTSAALRSVLVDPASAARLRTGDVFELVTPGAPRAQGVTTVPTQVFTSSEALVEAVDGGTLLAGVRAVLFDPEAWSFTPTSDQSDPAAATARAASAARAHGLYVIAAPALSLVTAQTPAPTGPRWQSFLTLGLAGAVAAHVDAIDLQAQSLVRDPATYRDFVSQAAAQARGANPGVVVLAGVSTNPTGAPLAPGDVPAAMRSVGSMVSGWWMNIPNPGPKCPGCSPLRPDYAVAALADPSTRVGH